MHTSGSNRNYPAPPDTTPVPEPGTMILLAIGLAGLALLLRKKSKVP